MASTPSASPHSRGVRNVTRAAAAILSFARELVADIDGPVETEHERIERVTNDYLDAYEEQSPGQQVNKKA
jgi:hypothetical protein